MLRGQVATALGFCAEWETGDWSLQASVLPSQHPLTQTVIAQPGSEVFWGQASAPTTSFIVKLLREASVSFLCPGKLLIVDE